METKAVDVDNDKILRMGDVTKLTGISKSGIYYLMKRGDFPEGVQITGKIRGWWKSDIVSWINRGRDERN